MIDTDTFLTQLYVMVDDFCHGTLPSERRPGPVASLTRSEVVTLALLGQWRCFAGERDYWRWASRHLRSAFPKMPNRSQFNRLLRHHAPALVGFCRHLAGLLRDPYATHEALDSCAAPTRNAKRRGRGWLWGQADVGFSNRLGWYEGFHVLLSVEPTGVITGFGFGAASASDQPLAETLFAARIDQNPRLLTVGERAQGPYVVDTGFEGKVNHERWQQEYHARVLCPPRKGGAIRKGTGEWLPSTRRWLSGVRQIVETVVARLVGVFRLDRERPHQLDGFHARLCAKVAMHNFCIWLNRQLSRPGMAFADLIDW